MPCLGSVWTCRISIAIHRKLSYWILEKWPPHQTAKQAFLHWWYQHYLTRVSQSTTYDLERSPQPSWGNAMHSYPLTCLQSTFWCQNVDCRQVRPFHTPCDTLNFGIWCTTTVAPLFDVSGVLWSVQMAGYVSAWQKNKIFDMVKLLANLMVQGNKEWPTRRGKLPWCLINSPW
jgi:hypothetical protein